MLYLARLLYANFWIGYVDKLHIAVNAVVVAFRLREGDRVGSGVAMEDASAALAAIGVVEGAATGASTRLCGDARHVLRVRKRVAKCAGND